ncbi:pyridoxal 5'-phosphate synthase [Amnibacterium flavum]|uniref:Oxidase n=1 Tax=Amnibacterium flavum TaxID=2173173 RepID=A0A2V1HZJ3_9MICO|nr:pyridoxal 5'-phosphate synthase [Amnibacterium flavum]PVZ96194.1 oxidase [Amnibacterium flavum]
MADMHDPRSWRERLGALSMPTTDAPEFDATAAPEDPLALASDWIRTAIEGGAAAPHAMTLATVAPDGQPTARTVLLHDFEPGGDAPYFEFASNADSPKGVDLADDPRAALVFHWREQHRQIRITGLVSSAPAEQNAADFRQLSTRAKAATIAIRQSAPQPPEDEVDRLLDEAGQLLAREPEFAPESWTLFRVAPTAIEFWQGQPRSPQQRLLYRSAAAGWTHELLWP